MKPTSPRILDVAPTRLKKLYCAYECEYVEAGNGCGTEVSQTGMLKVRYLPR